MDKRLLVLAFIAVVAIGLIAPMAFAGKPVKGPSGRGRKACNDNIDNDGDNYIDFPDDPGCANKNDNSELNPAIECDDGMDNDGDNDIDMADAGCSSPIDDDETNCGDSICEGGEECDVCVADCGICDYCDDSDGGLVYDVAGTVTFYYQGQPYYFDDGCNTTAILAEQYCFYDSPATQYVDCTTMNFTSCTNGACV
jgi:hypothetical protein